MKRLLSKTLIRKLMDDDIDPAKDREEKLQGKANNRFDIIFSFIPLRLSMRNYQQSLLTNIRPSA